MRYRDADGDLGGGEARVEDCRAAGLASRFPISEIAAREAVDAGVAITGELRLLVADVEDVAPAAPPPAFPGPVAAGSAVFCVMLGDQAGRKGPPACTGTLPITPGSDEELRN